MSLKKVNKAFLFLHILDNSDDLLHRSNSEIGNEKDENKAKLNNKKVINSSISDSLMLTNTEENLENVLIEKKYDEIIINFKNIDSISNKIVFTLSEKLKITPNCNFNSSLIIYGQHNSGKSSLLRGNDESEGLMMSVFTSILKYLSIKKKDDLLLTRVGCFLVQNNKLMNLTDISSDREYYDQIYINSEGSYIFKYFSSKLSLIDIIEKAIIKKKSLVNNLSDHILLFQIIIEVRSLEELSKRNITQNKIHLDFIEMNKSPEIRNKSNEINLKSFFDSLFVNSHKEENRVFYNLRNLLQRDEDFTYDLISSLICLKNIENNLKLDFVNRNVNYSKYLCKTKSRTLRNLDTTAVSTNDNLISFEKSQEISHVYEMLKIDEQVKNVVGRKDLVKNIESSRQYCDHCNKVFEEINEQTKYKKYLNENVREIDQNIDFIGTKLKVLNEEIIKESDRNSKCKLNNKHKQFSELYRKVCEESMKIQSLVKKVGRNLDNNLKQISTRMGKCANCSY